MKLWTLKTKQNNQLAERYLGIIDVYSQSMLEKVR